MSRRAILPGLLVASLLATVAAGTGCDRPAPVATTDDAAAPQLYTCGMCPQVVQEGPGTCPICGMALTPMGGGPAPTVAARELATLTIDPVVVQNMGVRVAPVVRGSLSRHVRTFGEIEVAEDRRSVVNLRFSGWIEAIHVDQTGVEVRAGQPLFDIYSPELVSAQEEYLLALRTEGDDGPLTRATRTRLELWDLSAAQIEAIADAGEDRRTLTIRAPRAGYVLHKRVVEGARVVAGEDLYRIGDLASIWVLAEVYELDAPWIAEGQAATMELSFAPGETYAGRVAYVYPTVDEARRTLTIRLEFDNPGLALRPGMLVTVRIEAQRLDDVLVVPGEAILRGADHQTVFVAEGDGRYRAQEIATGLSGDDRHVEVRSGLGEGDEVVVSGQFLLDSESQLQEAVAKLLDARLEARHDHGATAASHDPTGAVGIDSYWTCPMHPEVVVDGAGGPPDAGCPVCGMDLVEKTR